MSIEIVRWEWDLGNGVRTETFSPTTFYLAGKYTVELIGYGSDGTVYRRRKEFYVNVTEDDKSLNRSSYLDNYKSLHYGWRDEHGWGWSENKRDAWVLPVTAASVFNYDNSGSLQTIVWDVRDGKPYVINPRETFNSRAVWKDKAGVDGLGGVDIETFISLPEVSGEMTHYDIHHLETNVMFRPEIREDDYLDGFRVDFSMAINNREEAVEVQKDVDTDKEIVFYYQNDKPQNNRTRQLRVHTTTSAYQMLNYEAYFMVDDRFKRPFGGRTDEQEVMAKFGQMGLWLTRGKGYNFDRVTKRKFEFVGTPTTGPDGRMGSAFNFTAQGTVLLPNPMSGFHIGWYKGEVIPEAWTMIIQKDEWMLLRRPFSTMNTLVSLPVGEWFDIRFLLQDVTDDMAKKYANNFERYLPR